MMSAKRTIMAVMIQSPASERSSLIAASLRPSVVARRDYDLKLNGAVFYKVGPREHAGLQELHGPRKILRAFACDPRL
jgi:hypothetical protein